MKKCDKLNNILIVRKNRLEGLEKLSAPNKLIQNELNMIDKLTQEIKREERKEKLKKIDKSEE